MIKAVLVTSTHFTVDSSLLPAIHSLLTTFAWENVHRKGKYFSPVNSDSPQHDKLMMYFNVYLHYR